MTQDTRLLSDAEIEAIRTRKHPTRAGVFLLLDHIAALTEERDKLRTFARCVIDDSREGLTVDGWDIQQWGVEAGLLIPTSVDAACSEDNCKCADWGDFPQTCYRLSEAMLAKVAE